MNRVRVLMLTQVLPYPPNSGPQIKTLAVLRALAEDHDVTVASFVRGDECDAARRLEECGVRVHTLPMQRGRLRDLGYAVGSLVRGTPFLIARDGRAEMRRLVQRLSAAQPFDLVHADQLNMAQYAWLVPGARQVLDLHNALWLLTERLGRTTASRLLRPVFARDAKLLRRYEAAACQRSDAVLVVSDEDREALLAAARDSGLRLDADRFSVVPISLGSELIPATAVPRLPGRRILHLGSLAWPPNADGLLWLLREVWPLVRRERPDASLDVVGHQSPASVRSAVAATPGVRLLGYVEDIDAVLAASNALVVPLLSGSGMRVKILTALAHGLPTVTTSLGCEGIAVVDGQHLLIADDAAAFAAAVVRLLGEPPLAARLAAEGRRLIDLRYDARQALQPLRELYRRLATEWKPRG